MLLGEILDPGCFNGKLWNAPANAINDVSMDTTEKFTSSPDNRQLRTKVDTTTTEANLNDRKFSLN